MEREPGNTAKMNGPICSIPEKMLKSATQECLMYATLPGTKRIIKRSTVGEVRTIKNNRGCKESAEENR